MWCNSFNDFTTLFQYYEQDFNKILMILMILQRTLFQYYEQDVLDYERYWDGRYWLFPIAQI